MVWDNIRKILRRLLADFQTAQSVGLWLAAFTAGVVAVYYAQIFRGAESQFRTFIALYPWSVFLASPLALLLAFFVVQRYAPGAGGSGIPQILAAHELDGKNGQVSGLLSLRVAGVKVVSSILAILGGGAIGREGPTLQVSTCIFYFVGQQIRKRWPGVSAEPWIIAGGAAGLASAFNTPLGGIVYAIEELSTIHFHRVKMPLITSVIVAGLVSQWLLGPYLFFGFPKLNSFSMSFMGYAVMLGMVTGGMGALLGLMLGRLMLARSALSLRSQYLVTGGCGLLLAGLIFLNPANAGSGIAEVNSILFDGSMAKPSVFLERFAATAITYFSGVAGGIFAPSLSLGALLGSLFDQVLKCGTPNLLTLLGMIGFLTGITRTPFTAFILVLEMTDRHSAIFPMMICALIANQTARAISVDGFYEIMKKRYL